MGEVGDELQVAAVPAGLTFDGLDGDVGATERAARPDVPGGVGFGHFGPFRAGVAEPIWIDVLATITGEAPTFAGAVRAGAAARA